MTTADRYLEDAKSHILLAAPLLKQAMTATEQWQAVLFVAIGVEKLLKHLLCRISPAMVLKAHDLESLIVGCHLEHVTAQDRIAELKKKANLDVVTLKASVQRAGLFSEAVKSHSQFIHSLGDLRDIAAHRPWDEAEANRVRILLCRDLYSAVHEIAESIGLSASAFFGKETARIFLLSQEESARQNLQNEMVALLEKHKAIWAGREAKTELVAGAKKITETQIASNSFVNGCECPACGNLAVVTLDPDIDYDYDPVDGSAYATVVGVSVESIKCYYCSLLLDKYDQLQYVNADEILA